MKTAQLFLFASLLFTSPSVYADTNTAASTSTDTSNAMNYYSAPPQTTAHKKKKKAPAKKPTDSSGVQELTLPMAKGELQAEVASDVSQRERAQAPHTWAMIEVSSWKPNSIAPASNLPGSTAFTTKGVPAIDIDLISPLMGRELRLEAGLGLLALQRTGTLNTGSITLPQTQNGYVTMLRAGVEYTPWRLLDDKLTPYAEGVILPTLFLAPSSSFDGGDSNFGFLFSIGLGTTYKIAKSVSLDVGINEMLGSIASQNYNGFAVHGGVRLQL